MDTAVEARTASPVLQPWGISWPLIVGLAAFLALIVIAPSDDLLQDADTYWHLAAGRWILENGTVPSVDPFSHSMAGSPWTALEWLSEVIMVGVYNVGGWGGLVLLTAGCFAIVLTMLMRFLLARMEPIHALLFTGLAAGMLLTHVLARPHVMAWMWLALWVSTLVNAAESGRRPPWWLLGVMILWANMHGSFLLGLLLGFCLALDAVLAQPRELRIATAKQWGLFVVLALAAALLAPSGWGVYAHAIYIMQLKVALAILHEWLSPDFQRLNAMELWLLMVLGVALSGRVRLPLVRLLLLLALVHLALKHQRNISVLGLVAPFLIATPFARAWYATARPERNAQWLDRQFLALAAPARPQTVAISLTAGILCAAISIQLRPPAPSPKITPKAAIEAAIAAGAKGKVLNEYNFGGFLIHQGIPVFIDGRADMYGDAFLGKTMGAVVLKERKLLVELLNEHRLGWTLLAPGTPAIAVLDELPGWRRIHADESAVVHVRSEPTPGASSTSGKVAKD